MSQGASRPQSERFERHGTAERGQEGGAAIAREGRSRPDSTASQRLRAAGGRAPKRALSWCGADARAQGRGCNPSCEPPRPRGGRCSAWSSRGQERPINPAALSRDRAKTPQRLPHTGTVRPPPGSAPRCCARHFRRPKAPSRRPRQQPRGHPAGPAHRRRRWLAPQALVQEPASSHPHLARAMRRHGASVPKPLTSPRSRRRCARTVPVCSGSACALCNEARGCASSLGGARVAVAALFQK